MADNDWGSAAAILLVILLVAAVVGTAMPQLGIPVFRELGCQIRGGQYVEFFGAKGCV